MNIYLSKIQNRFRRICWKEKSGDWENDDFLDAFSKILNCCLKNKKKKKRKST